MNFVKLPSGMLVNLDQIVRIVGWDKTLSVICSHPDNNFYISHPEDQKALLNAVSNPYTHNL